MAFLKKGKIRLKVITFEDRCCKLSVTQNIKEVKAI